MKIGIVTFWNSNDNYGQLLQCYALQWHLRNLGHEPFLIKYDHTSDATRLKKSDVPVNQSFRRIIGLRLKFLVRTGYLKIKKIKLLFSKKNDSKYKSRDFDRFRQTNIQSTPDIYRSLEELQGNPPDADIYIAGSDQVWNVDPNKWRYTAYFLNFGIPDVRRISYAASIARKEYPLEWIPILKSELTRFQHISVREKESVDTCRQCDIEAALVLDPTVLIPCSAYTQFLKDTNRRKQIYLYIININSAADLRIDEIMRAKGDLRIKTTVSSGYLPATELVSGLEYENSTVEEWLSNIATSEYVITSSFHGVMFCLIFHTPFLFIPLNGQLSSSNNRVSSMLVQLNLAERYLNKTDDLGLKLIKPIDWEEVDRELENLREESSRWLNNAIS